jgi:hypothetical protein
LELVSLKGIGHIFCVPSLAIMGDTIANDARYTRETRSRIPMAKASFNTNIPFTRKLDLNLGEKIVKFGAYLGHFRK